MLGPVGCPRVTVDAHVGPRPPRPRPPPRPPGRRAPDLGEAAREASFGGGDEGGSPLLAGVVAGAGRVSMGVGVGSGGDRVESSG